MENKSILIRPAARSEAPSLGKIHVLSWQAAYEHLVPKDTLSGLSVGDRVRRWEEILDRAADGTLVAESDGSVMGFASIGPSRDPDAVPFRTSELYALYVAPEHWSKGVGWQLWCAARQSLIAQKYQEVTLWVLEGNLRGRRFYDRVGLSLDSEVRETINFLGVQLAEVRYRISLA